MKKMFMKIISLLTIISVLSSTTVFAAETPKNELFNTPLGMHTYKELEVAISQAEEGIHQQYYSVLEDALDNNDKIKYDQLAHTMATERNLAVEAVLEEFGFEKITKTSTIAPMSTGNDLSWTAEDAYYSSSDDLYIYCRLGICMGNMG